MSANRMEKFKSEDRLNSCTCRINPILDIHCTLKDQFEGLYGGMLTVPYAH